MRARESKVSVPGKIFVLGEYSVLSGGPAILATCPPQFSLQFTNCPSSVQPSQNPFPAASPAGRLWLENRSLCETQMYRFSDPYLGAGGFGRSSAEFGTLYVAIEEALQKISPPDQLPWRAREQFWQVLGDSGTRPSGIDLIAQLAPGPKEQLLFVEPSSQSLTRLPQTANSAALLFLASGRKQATHTHLAALDWQNSSHLGELSELTMAGRELFSGRLCSAARLGEIFNGYARVLHSLHLEAPSVTADLAALRNIPGVAGAKGCGALGVDVYALAVNAAMTEQVLASAAAFGFSRAFNFQRQEWTQAW